MASRGGQQQLTATRALHDASQAEMLLASGREEATVRLQLLDGFELTVGHRISVPTSAQRVIAFVALHERPLLRTFVASTLWPEAPEERALASLRSALWRLHRLGVDVIGASADRVWLRDRVDVDHRRAVAAAREILSDAYELPEDTSADVRRLDGTLLPDWYEDWALMERERSLQLRLHALERLSALLVSVGRHGEAVEGAMAAVAAEPLRESAHRSLIVAYLGEGNLVSAIRQYERYRRLLADELQVVPSELMDRLMASVP